MICDENRFWSKVDRHDADACWLWTAALDAHGYGRFSVGGRRGAMEKAPRVAWSITHGTIPTVQHVLHHCDTPSCVNPAHLFLGDAALNAADKVAKGRQLRGSDFPQARLTEDDARRIRQLYASGARTQRSLAAEFGIAQSIVSDIVNRRRWRHAA